MDLMGARARSEALEDLATLRFDEVARLGIPVQAGQQCARNFAVRGDYPITICQASPLLSVHGITVNQAGSTIVILLLLKNDTVL